MLEARKLILGVVLIVAATGSWWLTHQATEPTTTATPKPRHEPDYTVENFVGNTMDAQGERKYHLTAKRLTHYPDDDTTHLARPVLLQFRHDGSMTTTRADDGVIPGNGTEIIMTGNVHVTRSAEGRSRGDEVTTDRLRVELDR
jgi:lipopolysaccharide export system protein LptC